MFGCQEERGAMRPSAYSDTNSNSALFRLDYEKKPLIPVLYTGINGT